MAPTNFSKENLFMLGETNEGTVLHLATQQGHESLAKKIIELCPSLVTSTNSEGDTPLHLAASLGHTSTLVRMLETEILDDSKLAEIMNKDGLTPLHCAAMKGSVEILREFLCKSPSSFNSVTRGKKETVFHIAARHKKNEAFISMAKSSKIGQILYQLDADGNTVLHAAASVGSVALVNYIIDETKIQVTTKNNKCFAAVDLVNKDDENFLELSTALTCDSTILIEHSPNPKKMINFQTEVVDELKKLHKQMARAQSRENLSKDFEMQREALQSSRNTIIVVAVLIASVTFSCGLNPPGAVYQNEPNIGKSTVQRTLAFMIFSISNTIALFTSLSIIILLFSIIPYKESSLMKFLVITHWMLWVAVAAMATAYVAAAGVTLRHFGETIWLLYATLAIASLILGGMFVYLQFKMAKCMSRKTNYLKCSSSSPVPKNESLDMAANFTKGYYSY